VNVGFCCVINAIQRPDNPPLQADRPAPTRWAYNVVAITQETRDNENAIKPPSCSALRFSLYFPPFPLPESTHLRFRYVIKEIFAYRLVC